VHWPLQLDKKEIRLIQLHHQADPTQPLHCTIKHVTLDDKPFYKAISYMWGPPPATKHLRIWDGRISGMLLIRQNLYDFLKIKQLDAEFCKTTWLWVDQICINQADMAEKNHQVWQMSNIYSKAEEVIVWIETEFEGRDLLIRFMQGDQPKDYDRLTGLINFEEAGLSMHHVRNFYLLPYWDRIWIVQEIALATRKSFQLGRYAVPWVDVAMWRLLDTIIMHKDMFPLDPDASHGLLSVQIVLNIFSNDAEGLTWQDVGRFPLGKHCTKPQDRIYALLGLVRPELRLYPDYSLTLPQLCRAVWKLQSVKRPGSDEAALLWRHLGAHYHDHGNLEFLSFAFTQVWDLWRYLRRRHGPGHVDRWLLELWREVQQFTYVYWKICKDKWQLRESEHSQLLA
jgi:hypothetical protein